MAREKNLWSGAIILRLHAKMCIDYIVINTCALLLHEPSKHDDNIIKLYYDFVRKPGRVDMIISRQQAQDVQHDAFHDDLIRNAATSLMREYKTLNQDKLRALQFLRSKRIVHLTMTELDHSPEIPDILDMAWSALRCADYAYRVIGQSDFQFGDAEELAFKYAAAAVKPHMAV